jgi:hypothetical protein
VCEKTNNILSVCVFNVILFKQNLILRMCWLGFVGLCENVCELSGRVR